MANKTYQRIMQLLDQKYTTCVGGIFSSNSHSIAHQSAVNIDEMRINQHPTTIHLIEKQVGKYGFH